MSDLNYVSFFKKFVLRRKNQLLAFPVLNINDVTLPRNSLYIYYPPNNGEEVYGPTNYEKLVSTYNGKVDVYFDDTYNCDLFTFSKLAFVPQNAIKLYRKTHPKYNWARNGKVYYKLERELFVYNTALAFKGKRFPENKFRNYYLEYNKFSTILGAVSRSMDLYTGDKSLTYMNSNDGKGCKMSYIKIELPPVIPSYIRMMEELSKYVQFFENGKITKVVREGFKYSRQHNCYWLIDLFTFLIGLYDYSQFNKLSDVDMSRLHLILTKEDRCVIIRMSLLKSWLDELGLSKYENGKVTVPSKRSNVTKRFLLGLIKMVTTKELSQENENEEKTFENNSGDKDFNEEEKESGTIDDLEEEISDNSDGSAADIYGELNVKEHLLPEHNEERNEQDEDLSQVLDDTELSWDSEVDDKELELPEKGEENNNVNLTDLEKDLFTSPESGIDYYLNKRIAEGKLTVSQQEYFKRKAQSYKSIKMPNGETIEKYIKMPDVNLTKQDITISKPFNSMVDPSILESSTYKLKVEYNEKFFKKDIVRNIIGLQNSGLIITDLSEERVINKNGAYDMYKVQFTPTLGEGVKTLSFKVPVIKDDGVMEVNGNKIIYPYQRKEIPVRKVNERTVRISSYYGRTYKIERDISFNKDLGLNLNKMIASNSEDGELKTLIGNVSKPEFPSPRLYNSIAKRYKNITNGDLTLYFDYDTLNKAYEEKFKKKLPVSTFDETPVGYSDGGEVYTLDSYNNLNRKGVFVSSIEDFLKVDKNRLPLECAIMNIGGYNFPIVVVLCYYFGLTNLLKILKVNYRTVEAGERVYLDKNEYMLKFLDVNLIFNKNDMFNTLIFSGLTRYTNTVNFSMGELDNPSNLMSVLNDKKVKSNQFKEMQLLLELFIDPITKDELIKLKYPTDFRHLLIAVVKLLTNNFTRHENEIEEARIIGYERVTGFIYSEFVNAIRSYRMSNNVKTGLVMNPESIGLKIITDTSILSSEEANPMHELKEQEAVTYAGFGGRTALTMVRRTRGMRENNKGLLSEQGKDSAMIGFSGYLTSNAKIKDFRGNVDTSMPDTTSTLGGVSANLMYGIYKDSAQRTLFASVQASQTTSAINYRPDFIRTGYETVMAHRTSELYSKIAKEDGEVVSIKNNVLVVKYKSGKTDTYKLGLEIGVAGGERFRHTKITDLKPGDKFTKDDVLGWDNSFFERDFNNPGQVAYKMGGMATICLIENQNTFEDSIEISHKFSKESSTSFIKEKTMIINFDQHVGFKVTEGSDVVFDSILCNISDESLSHIDDDMFGNLNRLAIKQVRAGYYGKIINIDITYNGDINDMTDSLRELVLKYDKRLKEQNKLLGIPVETNNVGGNMSINKTKLDTGCVLIKCFIESINPTTVADKLVVGNQMKGTVGNIFNGTIKTEDGREVDIKFSFKSIFARMVISVRDRIVCSLLTEEIAKRFVSKYRG